MRPVFVLATLTLALLPTASASGTPMSPDERYPLADVSGVAFHAPIGMCILDEATCPFPWDAPANFVGAPCTRISDPNGMFVSCSGMWRDLWFNFILPGGASISTAGVLTGSAGQGDLIHIEEMRGNVAMSCDYDATPQCSTNFAGNAFLVEKWDCYIHMRGGDDVDC